MNKSLIFTLRSPYDTVGPLARVQSLSVALNDKIYYFGGSIPWDEVTTDVSCGTIRVFDTTSGTWAQIETTPPRPKCKNTKLQGVAVGTDIWVLEGDNWHVFDTIQSRWRDTSIQLDQHAAEHYAIAVVKDNIVYYDNAHGFEDMHVVILDTNAKILHSHPEEYGNLPYDRREPLTIALTEEIMFLYAPYASYEDERAKKNGEMFFYDMKQGKWARADTSKKLKRMEGYVSYIGRIEHLLLFLSNYRSIWTLDLRTFAWKEHAINEDAATKGLFIRVPTLLGDKIYCCMSNGKVSVIDITGIKTARSQQIMTGIIERAKVLLAAIKHPNTAVDEFSAEPILVDTKLEAVKLNDIQSYKEIPADFKSLFPLIDPKTIVSNTVPEPSDTVPMHKNYLHYLTLAWSNHFSVVLSPDIIFFTILCEIADEILGDPDSYRYLFTDSAEKKEIMSLTHGVEHIDVTQLIHGIAKNVPIDSSIFTANFTSSTADSQLAMQSAFCEAMSVYYYYVSGRCGIPRIKVLGTKEDWQMIEQKVHRMRTEVFSQDTTTTKKLSTYLSKIESQVRKIYTTRDPSFWKDMFYIDDCQSGHMAVVTGWIAMFYVEHEAVRKDGHTTYSGNDFYNYKAHISTVKWKNIETERHFELKCGLVSSRIVSGTNELDTKYPWLEPSFSHVIVETDGSGKMSPEHFKTYIETLDGGDRSLMTSFYELLKDNPVEFVKGDKELSFRYQLVGVQIDAWKEQYLKTGQSLPSIDFVTKGNCGQALSSYRAYKDLNKPAAESLANKICEYLALDRYVKSVKLCNGREAPVPLEEAIVKSLIGYSALEELSLACVTTQLYDLLAQLLLHPECRLKTLKIGGDDGEVFHGPTPNLVNFAEALLQTKAPLETFFMIPFSDVRLANSISHLCTKANGLKKFKLGSKYAGSSFNVPGVILLHGIVTSKTIEEITFFDIGQREVIQDNKKHYIHALNDELMEFIVTSLQQNPSLKVISNLRALFKEEQIARVLRIPTLREIDTFRTKDLSFLTVTRQLEKIKVILTDCTAEHAEYLREFLADENCTLKELDLSHSEFNAHPEAITIIARGLLKNKSLRAINLGSIRTHQKVDEELCESLTQWIEREDCSLVQASFYDRIFEHAHVQRILVALRDNKIMTSFKASMKIAAFGECQCLMDLLANNTTLTSVGAFSTPWSRQALTVTDEQLEVLKAAVKARTDLKCTFDSDFINNQYYY